MMQGEKQDKDMSDNEIDYSRVSDNDNGSFDTEDNNRRDWIGSDRKDIIII